MIGPLNNQELERLALLPRIGRMRSRRLYALDGTRWLDCWADGGRALFGHQTKGLSLGLKNEIDRGLLAPYPSRWTGRLEKALLQVFPGYSQALVFRNLDSAMLLLGLHSPPIDPLDLNEEPSAGERSPALWGRPLLPDHPEAEMLFPLLPLPGFSEVQPVLLRGVQHSLPRLEPVSPLVLVGMLRVCAAIQSFNPESLVLSTPFSDLLADTWDIRGPYMQFRGSEKDYEEVFNRLFAQKVLVAPSMLRPSLLPFELSMRDARILGASGNR